MDQAMSLSTPLYCVQRQSNDLYQRIVWRCVCIAQNCTPTANSRLNISTLWTHWTHVGTCSPEHVWHDNATLSNWGPFFSSCESFSFTSYFRVHVCCVWRREANSSLLLFFVCFFFIVRSYVHLSSVRAGALPELIYDYTNWDIRWIRRMILEHFQESRQTRTHTHAPSFIS